MSESALLKGKRAIVFGGGGSIGSAVGREFAMEGAEVFLAGRTLEKVKHVCSQINQSGGLAHAAAVDASDEAAVDRYVTEIDASGGLDIAFNAVGPRVGEYGNGKSVVDLSTEEFIAAIDGVVNPNFITARAAARRMTARRSGVIMFVTGSPARGHVPGAVAIGTAFGALETMMENIAYEVGLHGVRAVCLRMTANIDTRTIDDTIALRATGTGTTREQVVEALASLNFLKSPARVADTARAAVLVASDRFRLLTGTVVNSSAGAALD